LGFPINTLDALFFFPMPIYHPLWFDHSNIWRGVQVMKPLIMQLSSASCHFLPPKHPFLKDPQSYVLPVIWETKFYNHTEFHEAEPFVRSRQLRSYSRISQHFMEPEG
jgi:hypothetical protein